MWRRRRSRCRAWLAPLLWLLWQLWLAPAPAAAVYCDSRNLPDPGHLYFARNNNQDEVKEQRILVRLRCCAKNYDDILWYWEDGATKEPVRLPNSTYSSLIELQDNNRTLQSPYAQARDSGQYFCVARNRSEGAIVREITRRFNLTVKVDKSVENKLLQAADYEELTQRIGDKIQFECSMISDTPLIWFRAYSEYNEVLPVYSKNETETELSNVRVEPINSRHSTSKIKESKLPKGQIITIEPIQEENFGTYKCYHDSVLVRTVILKEGGYRKELKVTVIVLVALFILLAVLGPFCLYWRVEIRLFWKDRFGKLEENDEKTYDIFVSYDAEDAPFVLGTLVPVLEDHYRYRCFAWERDSIAGEWISDTLVHSVHESRRFLMILSPALLENRWCTFALHIALKAALRLHLHIICVKLHDIEWSQLEQADRSAKETIRQVLHVVRTVKWEPSRSKSRTLSNQQIAAARNKSIFNFNKFIRKKKDMPEDDIKAPGRSRFWRKLRLYLPPRRTLPLLSKPPASPTSTKSLLSLPHGSDYC